ncbi:MAG: hypothetical protein ABIW50_03140 [Candidatus Limnocylindria bacterium]
MQPRLIPIALVGVILATGCTLVREVGPGEGPADPNARMAPDLIVANPTEAAPGAVVGLTFPAETTRGILFVLEERVGDAWAHRYNLLSDGPGAGWERSWSAVDAGPIAVEDIGVGGPGPDRVPIPDTADAGDYRICTGNAGDNFCAPIRIGG